MSVARKNTGLVSTKDGMRYLNVGCGAVYHAEWNNIDLTSMGKEVVGHNVLKGFPYEKNAFDAVYCAHFLEHLSNEQIKTILSEMHRVLKVQGVIRVVVPDLEYNARLYLECLDRARAVPGKKEEEHYDWAVLNLFEQMTREVNGGEMAKFMTRRDLADIEFIRDTLGGNDIYLAQAAASSSGNKASLLVAVKKALRGLLPKNVDRLRKRISYLRSGEAHKWMYDDFSMARLLKGAGFSRIEKQKADGSAIAGFNGYCLDMDAKGNARKPHSLYMEAVKP